MNALSDEALRTLMRTDGPAGWRAFIDRYTPLMLGLIRRAGVTDRDEVMEVYVVICEQLSARGFERLKSQDVTRGSIGGWLTVVARHAVVDWVRSQKGRRRLFGVVRDLPSFDRRVFELYYWDERAPSEIAELIERETAQQASLADVFDALERIHQTLTARHRIELLALASRSRKPIAIDDTDVADRAADPHADPESMLRAAQIGERLEAALRAIPAEDAAIVRLKYFEGLSTAAVQHALGLSALPQKRLQHVLDQLRSALRAEGVGEAHAS